jgi:hypothetical protein
MNSAVTSKAAALRSVILPALAHGGYASSRRVALGPDPAGDGRVADVVAQDSRGRCHLIAVRFRSVPSAAEEVVPYEAMCLADIVRRAGGRYQSAYIVLAGEGWGMRDFLCGAGLRDHLADSKTVQVVSAHSFALRAARGKL